MKYLTFLGLVAAFLTRFAGVTDAAEIPTLLIDGQNNHDWKRTTPVLKEILETDKRFAVTVATSPGSGQDMKAFRPEFKRYRVIVSNYNGDRWSKETEAAFAEYVKGGGGFVAVHAANNSFPDWPEYNQMIGLGGWGGRTEKAGPYLRLREGKFVPDRTPGAGGHHGSQHAFVVENRDPTHPIMAGLPVKWMHAKDELYDRLRGPAENLTVLATAYADPKTGGSGEHEPLLLALRYGEGRVFHTALGHGIESLKCVGFATTLQRGTEWAATGTVTIPVPAKFPSESSVLSLP